MFNYFVIIIKNLKGNLNWRFYDPKTIKQMTWNKSSIYFSDNTPSKIIVDNIDDDDADIPLHPDKTIIHVTTLDELVQVSIMPMNTNTYLFWSHTHVI